MPGPQNVPQLGKNPTNFDPPKKKINNSTDNTMEIKKGFVEISWLIHKSVPCLSFYRTKP